MKNLKMTEQKWKLFFRTWMIMSKRKSNSEFRNVSNWQNLKISTAFFQFVHRRIFEFCIQKSKRKNYWLPQIIFWPLIICLYVDVLMWPILNLLLIFNLKQFEQRIINRTRTNKQFWKRITLPPQHLFFWRTCLQQTHHDF